MATRFAGVLLALSVVVSARGLAAEEVRGKVKRVDGAQGTITVTVGEADRTFAIGTDAKVVGLYGKKVKKAVVQDVPGGLGGVKEGAEVTITADRRDSKTVVSQVKVEDLQAKIKKKAKKKKVK